MDHIEKVAEILTEVLGVEVEESPDELIYKKYSGRGMYGDTCDGIVLSRYDSPVKIGVAYALATVEDMLTRLYENASPEEIGYMQDFADQLRLELQQGDYPSRSDNLGMDMIYY